MFEFNCAEGPAPAPLNRCLSQLIRVLILQVSEKVVQHYVQNIETHGKHVQYLRFLQTIVRTENQFIR